MYKEYEAFIKDAQRHINRIAELGVVKLEERAFQELVSPGAVESFTMAKDPVHFADAIAELYARYKQWALSWNEFSSD